MSSIYSVDNLVIFSSIASFNGISYYVNIVYVINFGQYLVS